MLWPLLAVGSSSTETVSDRQFDWEEDSRLLAGAQRFPSEWLEIILEIVKGIREKLTAESYSSSRDGRRSGLVIRWFRGRAIIAQRIKATLGITISPGSSTGRFGTLDVGSSHPGAVVGQGLGCSPIKAARELEFRGPTS